MAEIFLKEDRYGEKVLKTLDTLRKERKWIDFYIETKTDLVPVHRIVLAVSEVSHLQTHVFLCQDVNTLDLTDFRKEIVEQFISYLYTGEVKLVGESDIKDFINLCKKLDFKTVLLHKEFHPYNCIQSKLDGCNSDLLNQCTSLTLRAKGNDNDYATCPSKVTSQLDENFTCLSDESIKRLNLNTVFTTTTVNGQMFVKTNSKISENQPDKNASSKSEKVDNFELTHKSIQNTNFSEVLEIKQEPETYNEPDIKMSELTCTENTDLSIFYEIKIEPNDDDRSKIGIPQSTNIRSQLFSTENKVNNTKKVLLGNVKSTFMNHEEKAKRIKTLPDIVKQYAGKLVSKDVTMDQKETSINFEIKGSELGEDGENQQLEMVGIQNDMVIKEQQEKLDSNITRTFVKTTKSRSKKDNTRYLCQHCNYITNDKSNYNKHTLQHTDKTYIYIVPNKNTNWNKAQSIMGPKNNEEIKKSTTKVGGLVKNSSDLKLKTLPAIQPRWQISCAECGKTFRSKYGHSLHIKNKHNMDFKYLCSVCGQGFNQAIQYSHHCRRHQHQIKVDTCPLCKTECMGLGSLKRHLETCNKSGSSPHHCDICGSGFSTKAKLQEHNKGKHEEARYSCRICYKKFNWRSSLKAHVRCRHKDFHLQAEPE